MTIFETLPGESNSSVKSSIINLVCPQCGSMMEFQCNGGCRRNWFPEWEWVNFATAIFGARSRAAKRQARNSDGELGIPGARLLFLIFSAKTI
jgi:hypothetical protein